MSPTPSNISEDERGLIAACIEGDPDAWKRFERQYGRLIRFVAVKNTNGIVCFDADDAVSHVFERLLEDGARRLRLWRGESRFSTYLKMVAQNLVLDQVRSLVAKDKAPDDYPGNDGGRTDSVEGESTQAKMLARRVLLRETIETLSPKQKMIFQLRLRGLGLREIAETMRIPKGTVFAENSRAMDRVRAAMTKKEQP